MIVGQEPGAAGPQGMYDAVTSPGPAAPPPGAPPLPLSPTGQVQYSQGETPAPPPDGPAEGQTGIPLYDFAQGVVQIQQTAANFATATGGAGYRFDADSAQAVIDEINKVLDEELYDASRKAEVLAQINSPGAELASQNYVRDANESGQSYTNYLNSTISYLENYRQGLIDARNAYLEQEDGTAESLKGKNT